MISSENYNRDNILLDGPELLRMELSRRIAKNPQYSLRSFAKALGISPATLSLVMARKVKLSKKSITKISQVIDLTPAQIQHLQKDLQFNSTRLPGHNKNFNNVTLDIFKVFSDWQHYAILSLLEFKNSSINEKWIAKKLGISIHEARESVDRLKRLDLIVQKNGQWRQSGQPIRIQDDSTNSSARRFQKQLLLKAIDSLENDSIEVRDFSSMTFAMNTNEINFAKKKIETFRRQLTKQLEKKRSTKFCL